MGNVLETPKLGDVHHEDSIWLNIHNTAIFNDSFVANVYKNLPKFEGTEIHKVNKLFYRFLYYTILYYFMNY